MSTRARIRLVKAAAGGGVGSADVDFGGYKTYGFKRMSTVPVAADIGTDGLVLYEGTGSPTTDTIGGTTSHAKPGTGLVQGFMVTASASGTLKTLGVNLFAAAGNIRLALYSDNAATKPNALLCETVSTAAVNGWNDIVPSTLPSIVSGTNYWIGVQLDNANLDVYYLAAARSWYAKAYAAFDATWSAGSTQDGAAKWSTRIIYALTTRRLYLNINGTVAYLTPT